MKVILSLSLTIVFLISCIALITITFLGLWLHTYNVFTARTLVAEVTISQVKSDEKGAYTDVDYTPYVAQSALAHLIEPNDAKGLGVKQTYKIYGDTVYVSGPTVLFYDHLYLVNFQSIFKVAKIYGRYELDNKAEQERKEVSSFDLNGGIDSMWRTMQEREKEFPYNMFIRTVQLSSAGKFVPLDKPKTYQVFMNVNGFEWQEKSN